MKRMTRANAKKDNKNLKAFFDDFVRMIVYTNIND